jgi:hypothetical protein
MPGRRLVFVAIVEHLLCKIQPSLDAAFLSFVVFARDAAKPILGLPALIVRVFVAVIAVVQELQNRRTPRTRAFT